MKNKINGLKFDYLTIDKKGSFRGHTNNLSNIKIDHSPNFMIGIFNEDRDYSKFKNNYGIGSKITEFYTFKNAHHLIHYLSNNRIIAGDGNAVFVLINKKFLLLRDGEEVIKIAEG